jgi:hypothetical protein
VDYVPSLHLGYEKKIKERSSNSSKRACYWSDEKLSLATTPREKAQLVGLVVPEVAAHVEAACSETACSEQEDIICK